MLHQLTCWVNSFSWAHGTCKRLQASFNAAGASVNCNPQTQSHPRPEKAARGLHLDLAFLERRSVGRSRQKSLK